MERIKNAKSTVYGIHAVEALLAHSPEKVRELFINPQRHDAKLKKIIALAQQNNIQLQKSTDMPEHSQGVLAICDETTLINNLPDLFSALKKPAFLLILDGVQDPHNLGACLRSANAAGADAVIIPKDRAASLNATVKKVASGAAEMTPIIEVTNIAQTLAWLKEQGVWLYGMAGEADKFIYEADFRFPTAFVLGSEGEGLRRLTRESCDELLKIPMAGSVSSLNVSVAAGVCLFEAVRQRKE